MKQSGFLVGVLSSAVLAVSALGMSTVAAAEVKPAPAGYYGIHYYRPAKDYAPGNDFKKCDFASCWGVHAWNDAYDDTRTDQWFKPVFADGIDDFGAYFFIKANADKSIADSVDAYYIIHKGDAKDQCGKDQSWDHTKNQEIFVVQDDCKIYFSAADAMASPNYKK